jgi:hypothetical protein
MRGQILEFDDSVHRTVDELLPWFVNGTLGGHELAAVELHMRECARCQREVDLLQQLRAVCVDDELAPDATPSLQRLHERIVGRRGLTALRDRVRALIRSWHFAPAWAKWAIVAEFAGIVMLAAKLVIPASELRGPYQTLGTRAAHTVRDATVAVLFVPETTESELRRIVQTAGARMVDGPTESNAYVLAIPPGQRDAILAVLRAAPAVVLAEPLTAPPDR